MIAHSFEYLSPASLPGAIDVLAQDPGATRILGGGTWVIPDLNRGLITPRRVLDLGRVGLAEIGLDGCTLRLGAMTTYADVLRSELVRDHAALLCTMAAGVTGGRQVTQQATLGGSTIAARPQSDVPATLVALEAMAVLAGPRGERHVTVKDLLVGPMRTVITADEMLIRLEVQSTAGLRHGYFKLKRGGSSWPIATAAAVASLDASGVCRSICLTLGGVSNVPVTVDVAAVMVGHRPTAELVAAAADQSGASVTDPWGDVLAPASYRAAVAAPVARRALTQALLSVDGSA
jgi:aerobic carbon-monoxide dehydrogenase medium subunit